jgi:hypothetical protein
MRQETMKYGSEVVDLSRNSFYLLITTKGSSQETGANMLNDIPNILTIPSPTSSNSSFKMSKLQSLPLDVKDSSTVNPTLLCVQYSLTLNLSDITLDIDFDDCDSVGDDDIENHYQAGAAVFNTVPSISLTNLYAGKLQEKRNYFDDASPSRTARTMSTSSFASSRISSSFDDIFQCFPQKDANPRMPIRQNSCDCLDVNSMTYR